MSRMVKIECGISFRLRETTGSKPSPITCFVEFNAKPVVKIPTGARILPSKWNADKERPIGGLKGLELAETNSIVERLSTIRTTVTAMYRAHVTEYGTYPDKPSFKAQVIQAITGEETKTETKEEEPSQSLISFFDRQIELSKKGKRVILKGKRKGKPYRQGTITAYEGSRNLLQEYVTDRKLKGLDFAGITMDFYHDLKNYMFDDRKSSLNYFGKIIKDIKLFMGEAQELGLHDNAIYSSKAFIKTQEETDAVYLNIDQLEKIRQLDLTEHPGLANARDLFLLGAWTGLRFQDYSVLASKAKVMGNFIHIETEKVNVSVAIPILPAAGEILDRYRLEDGNYAYPRPISNQKLNDYIKVIAKMARLIHSVVLSVPEAGKRVKMAMPFYQAVDTHTARRSFATNMYKHYRLPALTIMKITGHTTESSFFKYIRMTPEESAQLILDTVLAKEQATVQSVPETEKEELANVG
ncbi:site-specific integrase [Sphingobacterium hotanense]|uniref:site-specific integrase n=1 Tax=Sphingobacterium hotanense TaxID=649196 RepID=UPI0021A4B61F|nr:site-specific integrase [Sphingobacterium hotanense]MCT1526685.1 site-specific integrase [Sphingobacterium hotanense]